MKILAGGPARETESEVFRLHREGLETQGDIEIIHKIVPDPGGARWTGEKIRTVAEVRQRFMEEAASCPCTSNKWYDDRGYVAPNFESSVGRCRSCEGEPACDALWLVDTDVICGPGVLDAMLAVNADVVYAVFWTECDWGGAHGLWPQVWLTHPYGFHHDDHGRAGALLEPEGEVEVSGGGACTLIRGRALRECRYSPILPGLRYAGGMWTGEDRTFSLHCETRGIRQVALLGQPIVHMYESTDVDAARQEVGL